MTEPLWTPPAPAARASVFARYLAWLERHRGLHFTGYHDTWRWSVTELEAFWASVRDFFDVRFTTPARAVLEARSMPGARWFPGAELNYAEHALRHRTREHPALLFQSETRPLTAVSWDDLAAQVAAVAAALRTLGVRRGDRVAAYLPNVPEAVVALLACASVGAVWSCCSPDFGTAGALERFRPLAPKLLIAADGYVYGGTTFDRRAQIAELRAGLPALAATVLVPNLDRDARLAGTHGWPELMMRSSELRFEQLPFDHPLWILFSSGTTGPPKAAVHGHGGILLEHLKALALQNDMRPGDRFLWATTTGWMMWNVLVGGLLAGCTPVLYDGSPAYPRLDVLWKLVQDARVTRFGAGAAFYQACMRARLEPRHAFDLSALRAIGSTGSPLPPEAFEWIYRSVNSDVWLASSSGGTEVATAFLGGCPTLPVHAGELQGPTLGAAAYALDDAGRPITGAEGELVITEPMPSMPLYFWNDPDGARYHATYFERFPGVWHHGDRVCFTERGSAIITGRSDATLNRHGVRIGTAEIYRAVESIDGVEDSLVVGIELPDGGYFMPLFVVLAPGVVLDDAMRDAIRARLRTMYTPRHVPDAIIAAPAVPRTANGKKLELAVKRVLLGADAREAAGVELPDVHESLRFFQAFAAGLELRELRKG